MSGGRGRGVNNAPAWMTDRGEPGGEDDDRMRGGPPTPRGARGGGKRPYEDYRGGGGGGGGGGGPPPPHYRRGGGGPPPPPQHQNHYRDDPPWYNHRDDYRGGGGGGRPPPQYRGGGGGGPPPPRRGGPPPPHHRNSNPYHQQDRVNSTSHNNRNNNNVIKFRSYEEEREWVEERRRKRLNRPSKFDILPTGTVIPNDGTIGAAGAAGEGTATAQSQAQVAAAAAAAMAASLPLTATGQIVGPQQTRHARRLYVGNLPLGVTEDLIHAEFLKALRIAWVVDHDNNKHYSMPPSPEQRGGEDDPILSVYINHERRFCFLEFKTIEMATACMNLDGLQLQPGQAPLKIKRPNDYNELIAATAAAHAGTGHIPELDVSRLGIISSNVLDGPNKIFIGGLHYHLTEPQVLELLQAFGKIKAFHLVKGDGAMDGGGGTGGGAGAGISKGYCFIEYANPSDTATAIQGLHGMDIGGGKSLTARLAGERGGGGGSSFAPTAPTTALPHAVAAAGGATTAMQQHQQLFQQQQQQQQLLAATAAPGVGAPPPDRNIVSGYDIEALIDAAMGKGTMPTAPVYMDAKGFPLTRIVATPLLLGATAAAAAAATRTTPNSSSSMVHTHALFPPPLPPTIPMIPPPNPATTTTTAASLGLPSMIPSTQPAVPPTTPATMTGTLTMNGGTGRVLVLHNMVQPEDLASDSEYESLVEEVREECAKFGTLLALEIPRQASSTLLGDDSNTNNKTIQPSAVGKIFLHYTTVEQAARAKGELHGRQFGPAVVKVTTYPEADFAARILA